MTAEDRSVYERVLGTEFASLHPELQRYFSLPDTGTHGHGAGRYAIAGSSRRWLAPLFALMAPASILFPELEHDVPFQIENRPHGGSLRARRTFAFPRRERLMIDEMRVVDGTIHDFLGRGGHLEVALLLTVADGCLRMTSTASWLRFGRMRLRLPALLTARVQLTEEWEHDHQRVSVSLRHPLLGEIFAYRGTFTYSYRPD